MRSSPWSTPRAQPLEGEYAQLERRQAAAADLLLLNKADIATPEQLQRLRQRFGEPRRMLETLQAQIPDELLYGERQDLRPQTLLPASGAKHAELFDSWTWQHAGQLDPQRLRAWLDQLPEGLFRLKGRVRLSGRERPLWLQYVGGRSQFLAAQAEEGDNCLVFIASARAALRERLEAGLQRCLAA